MSKHSREPGKYQNLLEAAREVLYWIDENSESPDAAWLARDAEGRLRAAIRKVEAESKHTIAEGGA